MNPLKSELKAALLGFDTESARNLLNNQIENKAEVVPQIIEEILLEIGNEWQDGELALSQVYMAGKICEELVEQIFHENEYLNPSGSKIAIVTFNDFHSLGKKIVRSVLKSVGYHIIDLGHGIKLQSLVNKIEEHKIEILLVSVLMLPSALKVKELRKELNGRNYNLKILVGGAPFSLDTELWKKVDADAMGKSPADAIRVIKSWIK